MFPVFKWRKFLFANLLLLGLSLMLTDAHRCYICGPLSHGFNKSCENFELNTSSYEEDCPAKHYSCSTNFEDANTIRQCEKMKDINDCKMANNIKYCYCSSNLCNGLINWSSLEATNNDDEDILDAEGSGGYDSITNDINEIKKIKGVQEVQDVDENSIESVTLVTIKEVDETTGQASNFSTSFALGLIIFATYAMITC